MSKHVQVWNDEVETSTGKSLAEALDARIEDFAVRCRESKLTSLELNSFDQGDDGEYGFHFAPVFEGGKKAIRVRVVGMYDSDFENYAQKQEDGWIPTCLRQLSDVFGTTNINVGGVEQQSAGCKSCGHGGRHSLEFFVLEPKL